MKKNRFDVLRKLVGAKPETDEEWFEAVDKYEDDIENIEKQDRKFHVKIIDFIKEHKIIIILFIIMIIISLNH